VGERTLAMAQRLVHQVVEVLAPRCVPLFLTDGLKDYSTALLTHDWQWVEPPRAKPMAQRQAPLDAAAAAAYAQVVKKYRRRRVVRVRHRVVFGTLAGVNGC